MNCQVSPRNATNFSFEAAVLSHQILPELKEGVDFESQLRKSNFSSEKVLGHSFFCDLFLPGIQLFFDTIGFSFRSSPIKLKLLGKTAY